ncbi:MAG: FAD-dependent oxidoreductase, partial [Chloroflexota bacterium]|nr:FAD-dependent oxidoreductase [Chloroflexota bacterium]
KDLYLARSLILAPGTRPRRLNVPGEQEYWGKGVSFCSTCDAPLFKDKDIAVVGGGNSALQESELLLRYVSHLTIIQHRDRLTATQVLQDRVLGHPGARVRFNSAIREIRGDGAVRSVLLEDTKSAAKEEMPVQGVFIFIGLLPNNDLLLGQLDMDEQGYVVTGPQMETKVPGVFVAGDVRRGAPRQIVTSASDGAVAALSVIEYLRGK